MFLIMFVHLFTGKSTQSSPRKHPRQLGRVERMGKRDNLLERMRSEENRLMREINTRPAHVTSPGSLSPRRSSRLSERPHRDFSQELLGYRCDCCMMGFSSRELLERHQRDCPPTEPTNMKKPHVCSVCRAAFQHYKNLLGHIKYAHGKIVYYKRLP